MEKTATDALADSTRLLKAFAEDEADPFEAGTDVAPRLVRPGMT
jgi:hypothetical protein